MKQDQRARLLRAKLSALVRDLRGIDVVADSLGAGAAATHGATTFVLQEESGPSVFGGAVLHAARAGAEELVLLCDGGAGVTARLAHWFALDIEVRRVGGDSSTAAEPDPMPAILLAPEGVDELIRQLADHDLEVVLEDGSWRGELLGLEVARLVLWPEETGGDGEYHLEAGVGRFDRDAAAAMHEGEAPLDGLSRAAGIVGERRHVGAAAHPLTLLARSRWLRADALADPALVGAAVLEAAQTTFPADSVRESVPCAALGATPSGDQLVVVFGAGAGLDLVPIAADTRELHCRGAKLVIAVPPRDHLVATDELASQLDGSVEVVEIDPGWA